MHFPDAYPLIATPRLELRPFRPQDAAAVQRLAGAREVADTTATIPHPYPDGMAEAWISTHAAAWNAQRQVVLAITRRADGEFLGAVGLMVDPIHERAELGYWLGVPFWNQGYATEAAAAVTDYGFNVLQLNRVQAHHMARNPASGRVLLKLGMRREGASPRAMKKGDRFEDIVFYGVLRRDWPSRGGVSAEPAAAPLRDAFAKE